MSKLEQFKNLPLDSKNKVEPALFIGSSTSVAASGIYLLQFLFPNLVDEDLVASIYIGAAMILPLITSLLIRRKVWSPASVLEIIKEMAKSGSWAVTNPLNRCDDKIN